LCSLLGSLRVTTYNDDFVGMTSAEVIDYDKRGEKIAEIIRQLTLLQKTQRLNEKHDA
jgi:hypothetical protein